MRKEDFRQWLDGKIKKKPISDCISRCTTVEYALKVDLDEEYRKDNGQAVIAKLSYNARDAKANGIGNGRKLQMVWKLQQLYIPLCKRIQC